MKSNKAKEGKKKSGFGTTLLQILGSLIKNKTALMAGQNSKWWVTLILFILSIGVAVTPISVMYNNQKGEQYIPAVNNGFEVALADFHEYINENLIDFEVVKIGEEKNAIYELKEVGAGTWNAVVGEEKPFISRYLGLDEEGNETLIDNFSFYYVNKASTNLRDFVTTIEGEQLSFFIYGKDMFYFAFYRNGTRVSLGSGNYVNSLGLKISSLGIVEGATPENNITAYQNGVLRNYKKLMNDGYLTYKNQQVLIWSVSALAFFTIIIFLGGLIIFIGTRSKLSEFRTINFYECLKIGVWASLAPAILSLAVGFLLPQFAMWSFIVLASFRYMWFSLRTLKPLPKV